MASHLEAKCRALELSPITEPAVDVEQRWCLASPSPCLQLPSPGKEAAAPEARAAGLDAAAEEPFSSKRAFFEAKIRSTASIRVSSKAAKLGCSLLPRLDAQEEGDDAEEIQLTIRVPRSRPAPAASAAQAAAEAEIARLREQLVVKEAQHLAASQALHRRSQENANLKTIVKELTDSKAKLASHKAIQSERMEDLQREYQRVVRLSDISRSVSKENMAKSQTAQQQLATVREDLARHKQVVAYLKQEFTRVQTNNAELQHRVAVLERLPVLSYSAPSACVVEFSNARCMETY